MTTSDNQNLGALEAIELSVVIPCLNEADTLAECLGKAFAAFSRENIAGEVIVADNGSTDESVAIAERLGARVVRVEDRGYGNALMGGIEAARGRYIIMGDADASYDFAEIPKFLTKLREGFELVQGCRLSAGGGTVVPGAMPGLHLWLGNPLFSMLARWWFHAPIHDVYCGLRGFQKALFLRLHQRCTGMEFATEMIIKASLYRARITEVPITLHRDGRKNHRPHLKTFHDGWRTLRFFLMSSPRWLFFTPGAILMLLGGISYGLVYGGVTIRGIVFDAHTLLFGSLAIMLGYQTALFGVYTKLFAVSERLLPPDPRLARFFNIFNLERTLMLALLVFGGGIVLLLYAAESWRARGFGAMDYRETLRLVIPGMTLSVLGFQTILSGFFITILGMRRR